MYSVYADRSLLYSPRIVREGYCIANPKLTIELNKAGSFVFDIPEGNPRYSELRRMKSIITVKEDFDEIWRGRILTDEKDFYNTKSVTCEGELAFMNDILYPPHDYSKKGIKMGEYFQKLMKHYAEECSEERKIECGLVTGRFADVLIYPKTTEYTNIWSLISTNLLGASTGKIKKEEVDLTDYDRYLYLRRSGDVSQLDFVEDILQNSGQIIEFGKNLLDLSEYVDASDVYTCIIPLGKANSKGERVNITSKTGGNIYLRSEAGEALFGKIQKAVVWENEQHADVLFQNGKKLLEKAIEMAIKITIRAYDLHQADVNTDKIRVGDTVHVVSVPHNISTDFLCTKIVYDISNPENTEYSFGLNFKTWSSNFVAFKQTYEYKFDTIIQQANENTENLADAFGTLDDLQKQVDNTIESWFYPGEPTAYNYPAIEWNTPELKLYHQGDLYYDKATGVGYRWTETDNVYSWVPVKDQEVTQALQNAANAQATADGKVRCFTGTASVYPTPPYDVGDLWVQGADGDILRCSHDRTKGEGYHAEDWVNASKYTDNSYAKNLEKTTMNKINGLQNQVDGKVELWYYHGKPETTNSPAKNWTDAETKRKHLDDLYYDLSSGKSYHWTQNGDAYRWEKVEDADISQALQNAANAQATADHKISSHTSTPVPPYEKGDIWAQGINGDMMICVKDRADGEKYHAEDWVKTSKYTDDTAANNAQNTANTANGKADNAQNTANTANGKADNALSSITTINSMLGTLQNQVDEKIETWFYAGVPTNSNAPANGWSWDQKKLHVDDLYFNTDTGKVYRYASNYNWVYIENKDLSDALNRTANTQAALDHKIQYKSKPSVPYDYGDIWVSGTQGELKVCVKSRSASEQYHAEDWVAATKYTDDTAANAAKNDAAAAASKADAAGQTANAANTKVNDYIHEGENNSVTIGKDPLPSQDTGDKQTYISGILRTRALWTNSSPASGMNAGNQILNQGQLKNFNVIVIGFKEYYSGLDSAEVNGNDIEYHILPLNGATTICTRVWDYTRVRKVTASRNGITFGASGWYENTFVGVKYSSNNLCCVPYIVYGLI